MGHSVLNIFGYCTIQLYKRAVIIQFSNNIIRDSVLPLFGHDSIPDCIITDKIHVYYQ